MTTVVMYDDVTASLIPADAQYIAAYADGRYENLAEVKKRFPNATVLKIDVRASFRNGDVLDVETGDAINSEAPGWFKARKGHTDSPKPILYTSASNVASLIQTMRKAGIPRTDYFVWSAHYSGKQHICGLNTCGYPKADGTQWTDRSHNRSLDESLMEDYMFPKASKPATAFDNLILETAPLHTEKPEWAAHAPEQVAAACQRGAHTISFTEVHLPLATKLQKTVEEHGYIWVSTNHDTALAVKDSLAVSNKGHLVVGGRAWNWAEFTFHGSVVTTIGVHWSTDQPAHAHERTAQTEALVAFMAKASQGTNLAFFMGDINPSVPQRKPVSEPRHSLEAHGLLLSGTELKKYPAFVGASAVGRAKGDIRVKARKQKVLPPLGSDHHPLRVVYSINRLK